MRNLYGSNMVKEQPPIRRMAQHILDHGCEEEELVMENAFGKTVESIKEVGMMILEKD